MKRTIFTFLLLTIVFVSCKKNNDNDNTPDIPKPVFKVTYEIVCTDCETIYYKDSLETQATDYHQNSSWSYTFYARQGQQALLFAYNTSSAPQGVSATIKVNDVVTQTHTNYCPISGYAFVVDSIE